MEVKELAAISSSSSHSTYSTNDSENEDSTKLNKLFYKRYYNQFNWILDLEDPNYKYMAGYYKKMRSEPYPYHADLKRWGVIFFVTIDLTDKLNHDLIKFMLKKFFELSDKEILSKDYLIKYNIDVSFMSDLKILRDDGDFGCALLSVILGVIKAEGQFDVTYLDFKLKNFDINKIF